MADQPKKPGFRETLNMPETAFPMKADLAKREPLLLADWQRAGAYEALRARRRGRPWWVLHDGPPYSNNHLHMGTAANKIWKDAAVRQASLQGFDSPYVPGWDNHGMPIEMQVGRDFAEKKQKPSRLELRRACRAYADKWIAIQRDEFIRLGGWGDWFHPYLTMAPAFEAEILETLSKLNARGFIQRGKRSIHWCPTDRTALAMAEIEYADVASPSLFVRFPLRKDAAAGALARWPEVSAVAWTTTPWTLPANLGLMVDPAAEYAVVRARGHVLIVAKARLAAFAERLAEKLETLGSVRGADLVGAIFAGPFGNDSRVVDGTPYVSMEDGTGIVHTAPGHGTEDFIVGQRSGLGVACPVDEGGRFTPDVPHFAGRSVLDVNDDIIAWLEEQGILLESWTFTHSYPHCWRCRKPVIFRATDQWFMIIDHTGHRERCIAEIERVAWDPDSSRNRIREAVRSRPDWCLSRQRSWGVGIPAVYCEACNAPTLDERILKRAAELVRAADSDTWYERPVEDFLPKDFTCPACGSKGPFRKEEDVLDVWFDSGATHRAVQVSHPELAPVWQAAKDGQAQILYFEGPDQHRGWFNSSLMVGVGVEDRAPFTQVATHGWVLDASGRAMHKSLGNVVNPLTLVEKYGADVVRWWALATDWRNDVRVGDEILQRVADAYRKVRNTLRFLLGNLNDFSMSHAVSHEGLLRVDRAFVDHLTARIARVRGEWTTLQFHRALDQVLDLCTVDLSAVFLDVAKDRLYTLAPDDPARRSAQTALWLALHDLTLAVSPALVFTADEAWRSHPALVAECESVHFAEWPKREETGRTSDEWLFLREVRDTVNAAIEPLRASKSLATTAEADVTLAAPKAWIERLKPYADELVALLIVAELTLETLPDGAAPRVDVRRTARAKCDRCWMYRTDVGHDPSQPGLCARCTSALAARA